MPLRRTLKNVVKNYSDAQVKVREATSNDPWGPSSTLMTEIADLTYNVLAFTEIMQMVWKRLNDHGRNWRHVYKSLVLLEYIVKTGSEKVAHQCRENIFAIQTLKDFQYVEDAKDHGLNVREKAKQLVSLLKDTERLKNERAKALKAKERFAQTTVSSGTPYPSASPVLPSVVTFPDSVVGKYSGFGSPSSWSLEGGVLDAELEAARPTSTGEEELQLELALAMSKEEHEQQMKLIKGDEVKLQMALEQSKMELEVAQMKQNGKKSPLADGALGTSDPWLEWQYKPAKNSWFEDGRWSESKNSFQTWTEDTTISTSGATMLEHNTGEAASSKLLWTPPCFESLNAFEPVDTQIHINDEFDKLSHRDQSESGATGDQTASASRQLQVTDDPWRMENLELTVREIPITSTSATTTTTSLTTTTTTSSTSQRQVRGKSPKDFLGENANLVNLDDLMSPIKTTGVSTSSGSPFNPFVVSSAQSRGSSPALLTSNPFVTPDMHLPQSFNLPGASVPSFTLPHYPYQQLQNQATPSLPENSSNTMPKSTYPSEFNPFL